MTRTTSLFFSLMLGIVSLCAVGGGVGVSARPEQGLGISKRQSAPYNVTWPDSSVVWEAGQTYNVTWFAPHSGPGGIYLSTTDLSIEIPLAVDFDMYAETVNVTVPVNATSRGDYVILLSQGNSTVPPSFWAESAPFGIGTAATTSAATGLTLDGSTFSFLSTAGVGTTPSLASASTTATTSRSGSGSTPISTSASSVSRSGSGSTPISTSASAGRKVYGGDGWYGLGAALVALALGGVVGGVRCV